MIISSLQVLVASFCVCMFVSVRSFSLNTKLLKNIPCLCVGDEDRLGISKSGRGKVGKVYISKQVFPFYVAC